MDEGFDFSIAATGELNAEIGSSFEIANGIFGGVNVTGGTFVVELRNDIGDGGKIGTSLATEPVE